MRTAIFRTGKVWLDLLAVIGIISLLVAITLPMLITARFQAYRSQCADNLRQVGGALAHYASENHGSLPSTRPSLLPDAPPDVSNIGFNSPDPFADPKIQNNVPSSLFLLVRLGMLDSATLVCQGSTQVADRFEGNSPAKRSNFSDVSKNLSYAMQNPFASSAAVENGFAWKLKDLKPQYVLLADRAPSDPAMGNSLNHDRQGQNVLYSNFRVEFLTTRLAGVEQDDIYVNKAGLLLASPADSSDNLLLPCE